MKGSADSAEANNSWLTAHGITTRAVTAGPGEPYKSLRIRPRPPILRSDSHAIKGSLACEEALELVAPSLAARLACSGARDRSYRRGPDGNIWITEATGVGRLSPSNGSHTAFDLPPSSFASVPERTPVTTGRFGRSLGGAGRTGREVSAGW